MHINLEKAQGRRYIITLDQVDISAKCIEASDDHGYVIVYMYRPVGHEDTLDTLGGTAVKSDEKEGGMVLVLLDNGLAATEKLEGRVTIDEVKE